MASQSQDAAGPREGALGCSFVSLSRPLRPGLGPVRLVSQVQLVTGAQGREPSRRAGSPAVCAAGNSDPALMGGGACGLPSFRTPGHTEGPRLVLQVRTRLPWDFLSHPRETLSCWKATCNIFHVSQQLSWCWCVRWYLESFPVEWQSG